jgi:RHS repeat-associated protein
MRYRCFEFLSSGTLYWYGTSSDALEETTLTGALSNDYVFFGGQRIARRDSSGDILAYFADHLGSSRKVEEIASGASTASLSYDADFYPFGRENAFVDTTSPLYKFTGKLRDSESGLDYFGARYNSSTIGRVMIPNPIGGRPAFPQSWNAYSYVLNNPLSAVDPTGLDCVYLNDAGNGIESIDQNSNAGECQENGGAWADGTITNVTFDPNSNDVLLGYANMGDNGSVDYSQITATPGQFNPGDEI